MKLLKNKTVIITGATRGIGKEIAIQCAKNGANIAFSYVSSDEKAKQLINELQNFEIKAKKYKFDVSDFTACETAIQDIIKVFSSIDVLINNAGITKDGLLMRMSEKDWDEVINTNLKSAFNMVKSVQKTMLKQKSGSIINMSSVVGIRGNAGQINYASSKAGLIGFSKSVALELGSRNIRSNVIAPGFIRTEMTDKLDEKIIQQWEQSIPLKRAGNPIDVANLVLFLASDLSTYITGEVITVDGGMLT